MPYKKNYRRRRRRTPWYNRKYSTYELADKAAKGVWYLKGLVNSEMNTAISSNNSQSITSTGYTSHLTGVATGDDNNQRTGMSIFARSLFGRLSFVHNSAGNAVQHIRVMIVKDKQQVSDTNPAIGDLLNSIDPWSPLDTDDKGRFQVLYDRFISVTTEKPSINLKVLRKMRQHIRYNGGATTDIQKNGLYLMMVSSTTANHPT